MESILEETRLFDEKIEEERNEYFEKKMLRKLAEKPSLVFKYKSISSALDLSRICDIFANNQIYLPTVDKLNDPLESRNSILLGIDESKRSEKLKNIHVLSLSSDPLLPTMWTYYASDYTGICIGFKTTKTLSDIVKVEYVDKQEGMAWEIDAAISTDIYKKSVAWKHESEYRIIRHKEDFLAFDADEVACVLFGCNMEKEIREHIEAIIPKSVKRFTVRPDETKFCLFAEAESRVYSVEEMEKILKP